MDNSINLRLDSFEGPFDLLIYLITKDKVDVNEISVTSITEQYLSLLFNTENMNMEIASEFLVMASTLLQIKSRMLLPRYEPEEGEDPDKIDSREELIMRLIEYKKFRDVTSRFREMADRAQKYVYKYPEAISFRKTVQIGTHNIYELWNLLENLIDNINTTVINTRDKMKVIKTREKVSVADKMKEIMQFLTGKTKIIFNEVFKTGVSTKLEIVAGFVAMLELSRLDRIRIMQKDLFGTIHIRRKDRIKNESEQHQQN